MSEKPTEFDGGRIYIEGVAYRYVLVQRLRMIDFLVEYFGYVQRFHIEDYFGISTPQATKDIKTYMKIAPDNIRYSQKQKRYVKTVDFERVLT